MASFPRALCWLAIRACVVLASAMLSAPLSRAQTAVQQSRVEVVGNRDEPKPLDRETESASRLGLSVRETPASIELLDRALLREHGIRSVTEAAQAAVGVLAGDFPAEPAAFSMRGFANSQINTLYNGIKIGPANMTSRVMDSGNLERIEILKGPASLMSGDGAVGGAVNLVTRMPVAGPIVNEAALSYGSLNTVRAGIGSGGSTSLDGLAYRFDLNGSRTAGFMDDTASRNWHLSAALDQRLSASLRLWGAAEVKGDRARTSWGTPLVPTAVAAGNAEGGLVDGRYTSNYNGTDLGAVAIDKRTLRTNYNVLDNRTEADETWLRAGVEWQGEAGFTARVQAYRYAAKREWFNNEVSAFNAGTGLVERERFFVSHDQTQWGLKGELQWDGSVGGMANRFVAAVDWSRLDFDRPGAANFPGDSVNLVNPDRGGYGLLTTRLQTTTVDNTALALENRLRLTPDVALIAGLRYEAIGLDRSSVNVDGTPRAGFPFSKTFRPTTGRLGLTWTLAPGITAYGQYATAADVAANNLFLLGGLQPPELTRARSLEVGLKTEFWAGRGQSTFALYDIERRNVYSAQGGRSLSLAGKVESRGAEWALALQPTADWNVWANLAYTQARYRDFEFGSASFSGNTPPNVPQLIANAGVAYRTLAAGWPLSIGASVRHVGARAHSDENTVRLLAYTVADARVTLEPRPGTQLSLRVRNLANRTFAAWADPFYPDQILIGAPRSVEVALNTTF